MTIKPSELEDMAKRFGEDSSELEFARLERDIDFRLVTGRRMIKHHESIPYFVSESVSQSAVERAIAAYANAGWEVSLGINHEYTEKPCRVLTFRVKE